MIQKILTPAEAWNEFYAWAMNPENGLQISPDNKHYLQKTNGDMANARCGNHRLRNIFEKYAPGKYEFVDLSGFRPVCSYITTTTHVPPPERETETATD